MTFDRPILLLALLSLPVLWLLSRMIHERRVAPVSSLLLWRRLGLSPEPPRETRRRSDRLLLLRLAAATAVSLGLAAPRFSLREAPPVLLVVRDATPSMGAFAGEADAAIERIRQAAPEGAELRVREIANESQLYPILASVAGTGDVVFVTDHSPEGPGGERGLRLVLVGRPVENVGITAAWIEGEGGLGGREYRVVVENFSSAAKTVSVGTSATASTATIGPGDAAVLGGPVEEGTEVRIRPGDPFEFDDRVRFSRQTVLRDERALRWEGPENADLARAMKDALAGPESAGALAYRVAPSEEARVVVAPPGERRAVRGGIVAGPAISPDSIPAPTTPLGSAARMEHRGETLLSDSDGPLASFDGDRVLVALDPGDPTSAWSRDPAFPIFFAEVMRLLFGDGRRLQLEGDPPDRSESATRPESAPADLTGLRTCPPETTDPGTSGSPGLYLLAAGLLFAHLVLERRRASPLVSSRA